MGCVSLEFSIKKNGLTNVWEHLMKMRGRIQNRGDILRFSSHLVGWKTKKSLETQEYRSQSIEKTGCLEERKNKPVIEEEPSGKRRAAGPLKLLLSISSRIRWRDYDKWDFTDSSSLLPT